MNRDEYRHLLLSGTVTFPATFPQIGSISLISEAIPCEDGAQTKLEMMIVREFPSAKVTITRKIFVDKVRAVFVPHNPNQVSYNCGKWLLADEISPFLRCSKRVLGIAFVSESESTLLEVQAGMTAGESAQYYPPLPNDRSINHYAGHPKQHLGASNVEPTLNSELMPVEGLRAFMFSCDGSDEVSAAMFSCDSSDPPFES